MTSPAPSSALAGAPPGARRDRLTVVAVLLALATALSLAVALGSGPAPDAGASPAAPAQAPARLPSVGTNFAGAGPFAVTVQNDAAHTYYSPTDLGRGGVRHPVVLWGNGTGTTPVAYDAFLRHLASHGFVVAAANTTSAGNGQEMLAGLDNLTRFNGQAGNRFNGKLDLERVGTTGHSQGGGGAMNAAHDPRVDTTFPLEPGLGTARGIHGTALYFAGQNDTIISPAYVRSSFQGSSGIPAAYAELAGATHFTAIGNVGGFRGPATAWARWQLAGDTNGAGLFVGANPGLASDPAWSAYEANSRLTASSGPGTPTPTTPPTTRPGTPTTVAPPTTTPPTTVAPPGGGSGLPFWLEWLLRWWTRG